MIDYYTLQKIADGHRADAVKAAAEDRLASQAAACRLRRRRMWSLPARLRALGFLGARPFKAVVEQRQS